jgi:hypothetical protein
LEVLDPGVRHWRLPLSQREKKIQILFGYSGRVMLAQMFFRVPAVLKQQPGRLQ